MTADDIAAVREELIVNRVTHLDYLADKLREDRVRRVIEPMLSGTHAHAFTDRDIGYARDLGLLARDAPLRVANPIYAEVLPRELAWVAQETLDLPPPRYLKADGSLDAELLMAEFQDFFRRHSEHWRNRFAYEGGVAAVAAAGIPAAGGERRRAHRAGVRSGGAGGVDLLIVWPLGGPGAGVRGGVQGGCASTTGPSAWWTRAWSRRRATWTAARRRAPGTWW